VPPSLGCAAVDSLGCAVNGTAMRESCTRLESATFCISRHVPDPGTFPVPGQKTEGARRALPRIRSVLPAQRALTCHEPISVLMLRVSLAGDKAGWSDRDHRRLALLVFDAAVDDGLLCSTVRAIGLDRRVPYGAQEELLGTRQARVVEVRQRGDLLQGHLVPEGHAIEVDLDRTASSTMIKALM
jgi:hypothetical protein